MDTFDQKPFENLSAELRRGNFQQASSLLNLLEHYHNEFQSLSDRVLRLEGELSALRGASCRSEEHISRPELRPQGSLESRMSASNCQCSECQRYNR